MARILVDVSALSMSWFREALVELASNRNVRFVHSEEEKFFKEISKNHSFLSLLKVMGQKGRLDIVDAQSSTQRRGFLESLDVWDKNECCDDSHLFAMVYEKPTKFVFTADSRLAKCRGCLSGCVDKRYRQFAAIRTRRAYTYVKHAVMS